MALGINGYNDVFRNFAQLFRDSVASMFGGEAKIPESVKKAMILGDYNSGKPLTARRILAVKAAIDKAGTQASAENPVKMNARLAAKYVDDAAKAMGSELSRPQKKLAESLVVKYGTDMSEMNAQMFAKFVVRLPLTDDSADLAAPQSSQHDPVLFGSASFTQRLVIDLT